MIINLKPELALIYEGKCSVKMLQSILSLLIMFDFSGNENASHGLTIKRTLTILKKRQWHPLNSISFYTF